MIGKGLNMLFRQFGDILNKFIKSQNNPQRKMSNLANYSPYNKTFKFIMFQNQAYHERNKRNMVPHVKTNLRYRPISLNENITNPEYPQLIKNMSEKQSQHLSSPTNSKKMQGSMSFLFQEPNSPLRMRKSAFIHREKRVIHKNQSFEKFKNKAIAQENSQLVQRLLNSSCQVVRNSKSRQSFDRHKKYRQIRKVYNENGQRKTMLALGKTSLLCPTLLQFNRSGLGPKFLQKELSMCSARSVTASRILSPRKSQISTPL